MATAQSRVTDMTRGDPVRLLLNFSAPLFLSNLLQQFYNLADTALAGHILGDAALAEIGATAALYGLIMNFAFGMNNGLALTVSRLFGAGDEKGVRSSRAWMLALAGPTPAVLTVVFVGVRRPLLVLLQVPEASIDGALAYLTLILLGIPLTMAYNMEASLLRAIGNSLTPLYFLLFSTVLNIGLDIAFMGPLQLGVGGAAKTTAAGGGRRGGRHRGSPGHQCGAVRVVHHPQLPCPSFYPQRLCQRQKICRQYVLGGPKHGPDECHLQHR